MVEIEKMYEKFCPLINKKCVGKTCISCKVGYTPHEDIEVLSHYECSNPECKKHIRPKEIGSHHHEYCLSCGAGRAGEKYGIIGVQKTIKDDIKEPLYFCTYFDTKEESSIRDRLRNRKDELWQIELS